jgi:8-oxo-dGTP diphosphatase
MAFRTAQAPELPIVLARLSGVQTERTTGREPEERAAQARGRDHGRFRIIVGAAIIAKGRVLACERSDPPEVAGKWEFPGGKVEHGESEVDALIRECDEELGIRVEVGERVGRDVRLAHGRALLKVYAARLVGPAEPQALEHGELRWLGPDELNSVEWLPADAPIVAALRPILDAEVVG